MIEQIPGNNLLARSTVNVQKPKMHAVLRGFTNLRAHSHDKAPHPLYRSGSSRSHDPQMPTLMWGNSPRAAAVSQEGKCGAGGQTYFPAQGIPRPRAAPRGAQHFLDDRKCSVGMGSLRTTSLGHTAPSPSESVVRLGGQSPAS